MWMASRTKISANAHHTRHLMCVCINRPLRPRGDAAMQKLYACIYGNGRINKIWYACDIMRACSPSLCSSYTTTMTLNASEIRISDFRIYLRGVTYTHTYIHSYIKISNPQLVFYRIWIKVEYKLKFETLRKH